MQELLPGIKEVVKAGCNVDIWADAMYSKYNLSGKALDFLNNAEQKKENNKLCASTQAMFNELQELGANVRFNYDTKSGIKTVLSPYKSDHRKITIIHRKDGTKVGYFGGTNIERTDFNDFMIMVSELEIVKALEKVSSYFDKDMPKSDLEIEALDSKCTVLFDIGTFRKSTIFAHARKLIHQAKDEVIYVNQMPPERAILIELLKAEKRGAKVTIVLPNKDHPNINDFPYNLTYKLSTNLLKRHKSSIELLHIKEFTHAKILIADGKALVGSHNLSSAGMACQVKEISAIINDEIFLTDLKKFIKNLITL
jgi:phosphatidylserine/phosphatidylglycerophosphate/cardiolipin synthase-like enzyme